TAVVRLLIEVARGGEGAVGGEAPPHRVGGKGRDVADVEVVGSHGLEAWQQPGAGGDAPLRVAIEASLAGVVAIGGESGLEGDDVNGVDAVLRLFTRPPRPPPAAGSRSLRIRRARGR